MLFTDLCIHYLQYSSAPKIRPRTHLVLLLHGRAANELDLFDLASQFDSSCVVLSLRAPLVMGVDSYGWFETSYAKNKEPSHKSSEADHSLELLTKFILEAQRQFEIASTQTYLIGFSQGAIMAMGIFLRKPELIAGVAALSGRILPEHVPAEPYSKFPKGFPLLLSHGTDDEVLAVKYARDARKILGKLPICLNYHEYPMGHDVTEMNFKDVIKWISKLMKSSQN